MKTCWSEPSTDPPNRNLAALIFGNCHVMYIKPTATRLVASFSWRSITFLYPRDPSTFSEGTWTLETYITVSPITLWEGVWIPRIYYIYMGSPGMFQGSRFQHVLLLIFYSQILILTYNKMNTWSTHWNPVLLWTFVSICHSLSICFRDDALHRTASSNGSISMVASASRSPSMPGWTSRLPWMARGASADSMRTQG